MKLVRKAISENDCAVLFHGNDYDLSAMHSSQLQACDIAVSINKTTDKLESGSKSIVQDDERVMKMGIIRRICTN